MRKVLAVILALTALLVLSAGCSGGVGTTSGNDATPTPAGGGNNAAEEYTIRIAWWGNQIRHDATVAALDLFMKNNSNIVVESEFTGWDGYWDKIATQAAANSLPHVWQQSISYVAQYAVANQILDLQPYIDSATINLSDWSKAAIDLGRLTDGKIYSLSMGNTAHALCFDPELLSGAGIAAPTNDWNWDQYFDTMRQVKDKLGIFGDASYTNMNINDGLRHYVFSLGHTFYTADQKALGFPQELMVEWLTREYAALQGGLIPDPAVQAEITTPEQSLFVTGEAAMNGSNNSNTTVALMTTANKVFQLVAYPHESGETRWGTTLGPAMMINLSNVGTNAEKNVSAKLVDFLLNDIEANKILLGERGVPGSTVVTEAIIPLLPEYTRVTFEYVNEISPKLTPNPEVIGPPVASEVVALYQLLHDQVMFGELSVEDCAKRFFEEANALLAR